MRTLSSGVTSAAILMLSFLIGCSAPAVRIPPVSAPVRTGAPTSETLRASFKGRVDLGGDRRRFEGTLALETPDRLYVEILGPVGGVRAVVTASGKRVIVLFPGTREFVDEEATASTYEALLGVPLDTSSLVDLIRFGGEAACAEERCERRILLTPDPGGAPRELLVTRRDDLVTARPAGSPGPAGFQSLELRLRQAETSGAAPIGDDLFSPPIPEGWARLRPAADGPPGALLLSR